MAMMQSVHPNYPRIIACGDSALVVEFSDQIDEETNERVIALADMLATRPITGVIETVPTYRSLLVAYDPVIIRGKTLSSSLQTLLGELSVGGATARRITVPVLYGEKVGIDLDELADMKQMSREELIALHASADYRVYMIGFAPGFSYLGGLPQQLHTPRLAVPRQRIEASSIGIGGKQASINSVPGPSGWRFIGRTPLRLFDPSRPQPFLLRAGDRVRFRPVDADEAERLDAAVSRGEAVEEWETP
ncbi:5-oxoprolinase subunit PxpB [Rhizobium sp. 16-449-1b]|uniref:5-oxoprolinase subunit PxpB n=1 Tax=Rhizobium sp. 16-449-1b TaxID=2819989 RepID=UPI001ADADF8D|nr:5-oxoprolinase subunit PxpB [Rhizobium sp. 16-449-1b]MBO9195216.1 5-oxoprolinase subunit PxpB [Rhizobium sp. 16-449-1b]